MPGMDFYSGAFSPDKIETEARTLNEKLIALCQKEFDTHNKWFDIGAEEYRKRRDGGETAFPKPILLARAKLLEVPSRDEGRPISLRCFVPKGQIHGIFLHIHGGGWVLSNAGSQDPYLERIADESGMIAASIEYRLAPEHPSPAAENDCFDVAHYLMSPQSMAVFAQDEKVRKNIVISGESAGAHLAASTMIALKHRHEQTFAAAILNYGVFDLSLTPSVRKTTVPLVLCRKDMEEYIKAYLPDKCHSLEALRSAEHSPLYADLAGLCPAIFNCGSVDCLLDDTIFMAGRYTAAGNECKIKIYPGGAHGFATMMNKMSDALVDDTVAFLYDVRHHDWHAVETRDTLPPGRKTRVSSS